MNPKISIKSIFLIFFMMILIGSSCAQIISNSGTTISILGATEVNGGNGDFSNSSGTINNNGVLTFGGDYTNAGIFNGSGTYNVGGSFFNMGTYNSDTSTFNYNGIGTQTVLSLNYSTLILSNSGIKTFDSGTTGISDSLIIIGATGDAVANLTTINYNGIGNQNLASLTYYNLTCSNSGSKLSDGDIILNNIFTLSGTASFDTDGIANDKIFTLRSDSLGTGSIGFLPTPTNFSGNITMQRYINAGGTNWRFLTSATSGMTLAEFAGDFETTGFTGSDYPNWPSAASPWPSIYYYNEAATGVIGNGFLAATNTTNSVLVGEGLWVWSGDTSTGTQPFTIDMFGPANTGNINLPVSYTNTGSPIDDGWSMVGNPYPSSIDWDTGVTRVAVDDAIYIWNPDLGQYASYVSGISTNGGSSKIASSQAFWVHSTSIINSILVTESSKVTDDAPFLKQSPTYLTIEAINSYGRDEAVVNFSLNANLGFSGSYDAYKIASVETYRPSVSTIIDDSVELSINQLPEQGVSIPLKVTSSVSGVHQINFLGLSNFTNASCILLEDLFTGIIYDLTSTSSITVNISDTTTIARFLIRFGSETSTLVSDISCYGLVDGSIVITKDSPDSFDVIWKDDQNNVLSSQTNVFGSDSISNLSSGTYIIETLDNFCGSISDSVLVTEPLPIVGDYTIPSDTIDLGQGDVANFTNQSSNATYYYWDFGDMNYSSQTNPTHQYNQAGIYNIVFTAYQSPLCYSTVYRDITVLDIVTAINSENEKNNNIIWINNNVLNITSSIPFDRVEVRNVLGQEIFRSIEPQNKVTFDLKSLSSQVLIVRSVKKGEVHSSKIHFIRK